MNHKREKQLDKILEGDYSADNLLNYWFWLKLKLPKASKDLNEYWNYYYLQNMKSTFFDACKEHPQYHKFYVEELMRYDGKYLASLRGFSDKEDAYEIAEDLKAIENEWSLPQELRDSLLIVINSLNEKAYKQD